MKNNKGITIIALVVTIIVLLILSSISISYVINKNGIIDNVNNNKENAEIKSIESKLQAESTSFNIQNNGKLNLGKYISKVEEIGDWTVADNDDGEDEIDDDVKENVREIVVNDKYVFETKLDSEGIKIEYLGKKGELGPRIIWHTYTSVYDPTTNEYDITLNVVTRRNKGGTIQYWIKESGEKEYQDKGKSTENTYTFKNLYNNKKYTIKVIAEKDNKQSAPYIIDIDMDKLPELTDKDITFTKDPASWTNGTVKVTAQTKMTGYTIQTSQDKATWENSAYQRVTKNGKVYARLSDGYSSGEEYDVDVENIDKLPPNEFTPTATSTTKSITVKASTTDASKTKESGSSGIAGYRFSLDNGSTWTAYQDGGTYTWNNLSQTTNYTIKVEAKDNAGNVRQESVTTVTKTITALTTANTTFEFEPSEAKWTNQDVKVTVSTTADVTTTGFVLQTSTDGKNWYTTSKKPANTAEKVFTTNGIIYARLYDGRNAGEYSSRVITKIDKLAPKSTDFKATFIELKDADSDTKTEYGFKASLNDSSPGGSAGYINWYSNTYGLQAGEVFYSNENKNYYLCIKSLLEKTSSVNFSNTEHFESIGTSYPVSLNVTGTAEDADATSEYGKSGIDKYLYSKDGGKTWSENGTYKYSDLNEGNYSLKVKAIDKAGNETISAVNYTGGLKGPLTETVTADQIADNPENYYGKIVTNYKSSNGWSGWKIFHCKENSIYGKIFLIADDFVPNSIIPDICLTKTGTYKATWSDMSKLNASDSILNSTLTLFMGTGFDIAGKNYKGTVAASKLLNTENWSKFADSRYAAWAIGGPTIEMWMASWNTLYSNTDPLFCNKTNNFGYYVGTTNNPSTDYIDKDVMNKKQGYNNSLYYLSEKSDGTRSYWCASPSSYVDTDEVGKRLINIDAVGWVGSDPVYFNVTGIRPVVCLSPDFKIKIIK